MCSLHEVINRKKWNWHTQNIHHSRKKLSFGYEKTRRTALQTLRHETEPGNFRARGNDQSRTISQRLIMRHICISIHVSYSYKAIGICSSNFCTPLGTMIFPDIAYIGPGKNSWNHEETLTERYFFTGIYVLEVMHHTRWSFDDWVSLIFLHAGKA